MTTVISIGHSLLTLEIGNFLEFFLFCFVLITFSIENRMVIECFCEMQIDCLLYNILYLKEVDNHHHH
ncbi:hypothetical protein DERF_011914 [Dermatophagoides farinae]|uniref:Uncharacterized protein n=1 Tax=Dermatophagoides farinae TaxID=6954 RepID=A0A922HRK1_DERFA|nr:hypothetical protein DERF_011914 [Dermatophagoides farinae]